MLLRYGYWGLLLFSFLSASIIPVSSEAGITGAILMKMDPWSVLIWASIGNCLGIVLNYGIGFWAGGKWLRGKTNRATESKAYKLIKKYGVVALFLSWVPLIGDPMTIAAGLVRVKFVLFVVISASLRILRYYVIVLALA